MRLMLPQMPVEFYTFQFLAYKEVYQDRCYDEPNKFEVVLGEMPDDLLGICFPNEQKALVILNEEHWNRSNDLEREELVFHELGHCLLGRPHREGDITFQSTKMPRSIMKCCDLVGKDYPEYHEYYLMELFRGD